MPGQKPRWPTREETIENAKKGFIDDRADAIPPFDLEEWEIRGIPQLDAGSEEDDIEPRNRSKDSTASTPTSTV